MYFHLEIINIMKASDHGSIHTWSQGSAVLWYYVNQKTPKNNSSYNYTGHYYSFFCSPAFCVIYLVTIPFFQ